MKPSGPTHESCARCGYNLEGIGPDTPCPECACPRVPLDAFFHCPTCGYHLTGLAHDANCPECGKPVSDAIVQFPIYRAGAAYVRRIASGTSLVLFAACMSAAAFILLFGSGFILPLAARMAGGMANSLNGFLILMLVYLILILGSSIIWLVGWIRATSIDPVYANRTPAEAPRVATRGLAIAVFCMSFIVWIPLLGLLVILAQFICATAMFFYAATYIREIGKRIPSPKLVRISMRLRQINAWLLSIFLSFLLIGFVLASIDTTNTTDNLVAVLFFVDLIIGPTMLVIYFRLLYVFAITMKQSRKFITDLPKHTIPRRMPAETLDGVPS